MRDGLTDYLQFVIDRTGPYAAAAPLLAAALRTNAADAGATRDVVDLGSGAGGPWRTLAGALAAAGVPVRVRLTDAYPNAAAFARLAVATGGVVTGAPQPVSADAVPADLAGFRTLFSAFHHYPPPLARRVLADAVARGAGIGVFEATRRDPRALLVMLAVPFAVLLATPLLRPFRWSRLLLTYVLPLIPLVALVDGVVSCLRTYTPDELRALARAAEADAAQAGVATGDTPGDGARGDAGYAWTAGEAGAGPIPMTYLVGRPGHP
ncbi:hypothetical protein tb265_39760 [Gemmatimonadetes bacterium T265]|nr:hypothetical protein tb265_39760 [Gemmatimonadetes bacterium T265]